MRLRFWKMCDFQKYFCVIILAIFCLITIRWIPVSLTVDKSTLVQVMARCCQATSHYLNRWWLSYLTPSDIIRGQWVNSDYTNNDCSIENTVVISLISCWSVFFFLICISWTFSRCIGFCAYACRDYALPIMSENLSCQILSSKISEHSVSNFIG